MKSAEKIIEKIFKVLENIRVIEKKNDVPLDTRVLIAYKVFRALDRYRFRLQPADLDGCLESLLDSKKLLEKILKECRPVQELEFQTEEPKDKARRMQYLYGLAWAQQSDYEY